MPQINVTTKTAKQVWQSPDGQRTIYKLTLDYNGQPVSASTYSKVIAEEGWSGEVETYEKPNPRGGSETFVKQPPKEAASSGTYGSSGGRSYSGKPQDQFTMFLSYAKDIAVALIGTKAYTPERLSEIVAAVSLAGEQLYDARPGSPTRDAETAPEKPDAVVTNVDEPVDLSLVDKVFNTETEPTEELPWDKIKG